MCKGKSSIHLLKKSSSDICPKLHLNFSFNSCKGHMCWEVTDVKMSWFGYFFLFSVVLQRLSPLFIFFFLSSKKGFPVGSERHYFSVNCKRKQKTIFVDLSNPHSKKNIKFFIFLFNYIFLKNKVFFFGFSLWVEENYVLLILVFFIFKKNSKLT